VLWIHADSGNGIDGAGSGNDLNVHVRALVAEDLKVEMDRVVHSLDCTCYLSNRSPEVAVLLGCHRLRIPDVTPAKHHHAVAGSRATELQVAVSHFSLEEPDTVFSLGHAAVGALGTPVTALLREEVLWLRSQVHLPDRCTHESIDDPMESGADIFVRLGLD
jgi:hypothetical protein